MIIYLYCLAVLLAGVALAFYLKREGERSWAEYQRQQREREMRDPLALAFQRITVGLSADFGAFNEALKRTAAAVERLGREMDEQMRPVVNRAGSDVLSSGWHFANYFSHPVWRPHDDHHQETPDD